MRQHVAHERATARAPGGATPSSTRSIRAPFRTPTATARATCAGSPRAWTTSRELGADAVWLSPVYPSPMADGGYDVADYEDVDPRFGTLADADALIAAAHERGLRLLMDVVPCHTSIEHPWFAEHPERYVWSDRDGPQNNWIASFGGAAWSPDARTGRWYLHSFYPEQPDLDWRREDVRAAVGRGAALLAAPAASTASASTRSTACSRTRSCATTRPPTARRALPEHARRRHAAPGPQPQRAGHRRRAARAARRRRRRHAARRRGLPAGGAARALPRARRLRVRLRAAARAVGRRGDARARSRPRSIPAARPGGSPGCSPTTTSRACPTASGERNVRAAALLALTLPGAVFVYQGDEIGMADGPGRRPAPRSRRPRRPPPPDAAGTTTAPHGGFTTADAEPWLPAIAVDGGGVAQQRAAARLDARAVPRPHRRAPRARPRPASSSTTSPTACSPTAAGPTTSSRSTPPTRRGRLRRRARSSARRTPRATPRARGAPVRARAGRGLPGNNLTS